MKVTLFISIVLTSFLVSGCLQLFDCAENTIREVISPDGKYTATLFERNCGATTSFAPHINLRETSMKFVNDELNRIEEGYVPTPDSIEKLELNWEDTKTLKIKCPTCVNLKETNWNGVRIIYSK